MLEKFPRFLLRYAGVICLVGAITSGGLGYYALQLFSNLKTDIEELLPTSARSVIDLKEVTSRLESVESISVLVFSENPAAAKKFSIDLATALERLPRDEVAYVEYRIDDALDFFKKRKALYIDLEDLKQVRDFLIRRINYEKALHNPLNIFAGTELKQPVMDLKALQKRYEGKVSQYEKYPEGFYATVDGKIRLLEVFLPGKFSGIHAAHRLRENIDRTIVELKPASYAPDLHIKFAGGVQNLIEEHASLVADLLLATVLTSVLVAIAMWIFYRSFLGTLALVASLLVGTLWTFGISYFAVGYLNANSAFMGSIVIGNGINFGIIFLARYIEERRKQSGHDRAIYAAITKTLGGTAVAAAAAALAYGSLILTSFRGFSQFGIIGLIGMTLCWISSYTIMPALLTLFERWGGFKNSHWAEGRAILSNTVSRWVEHFPKPILAVSLALCLFSVAMLFRVSDNTIETNLKNLRDKKSMESGSGFNSRYVDQVLGHYGTPIVFLPHSLEESRSIAQSLRSIQKAEGKDTKIDIITHVDDFVPREQEAKIFVMNEIRKILTPKIFSKMDAADQKIARDFLNPNALQPITRALLPDLIQKKLREKDGSMGKLVLVEPPMGGLPDGNQLLTFIDQLRKVADSVRSDIPVAGQLAVSADMVHAIRTDGPKATIFAFLAVIVLVALLFRRLSTIAAILISLLLGVLWMIGILLAARWKINFLNFIALPITFGIGVDYAVNIFSRWTLEGRTRISKVISSTGGAVGLASFTTTVGYGSLLIASNQAFISFGKLAVLGEFTCLSTAIFTLPAVLRLREIRREKRLKRLESTFRSQPQSPSP